MSRWTAPGLPRLASNTCWVSTSLSYWNEIDTQRALLWDRSSHSMCCQCGHSEAVSKPSWAGNNKASSSVASERNSLLHEYSYPISLWEMRSCRLFLSYNSFFLHIFVRFRFDEANRKKKVTAVCHLVQFGGDGNLLDDVCGCFHSRGWFCRTCFENRRSLVTKPVRPASVRFDAIHEELTLLRSIWIGWAFLKVHFSAKRLSDNKNVLKV